ncbi:hypothetical protein OKA05_07155 [Luteolibacter arcticus]|uniref:Nucleotidyltransferase domain-containing protein n=1 Tax=Luteolibacter arcticus TaxID=1581411 RepID=A0ABT3GFU1_9BACT|nr:hypothetical protein [Luteolibacter arcticus]MCW1922326.1 hypothetical protein [Luteolibacter arcticus]
MQAVCDVLEELLKSGVVASYAIGGATAAGFHGEPLATRDIDVFVFLNPQPGSILLSLDPVFRELGRMGFDEFDEEGILIHGFPVQFLAAAPGLESEAITEAGLFEWDGHRARVMSAEHLAAIALTVGRPKDRARVVYLVSLPAFDRNRFGGILERHNLLARWQSWAEALGLSP